VTDDEHDEEEGFSNTFENPEEEPEDFLAYVNRKLKASRAKDLAFFDSMGRDLRKWDLEGRDLERRKVEALETLLESERNKSHTDPDKLSFEKDDLELYVEQRKEGLAPKSLYWVERSSKALWKSTNGEISQRTMMSLRETILNNYKSADSHSKMLGFAAAFLRFLARTKIEPRYTSFAIYLERSRAVKEKKRVTGRIVTKEDIANVLAYIRNAEKNGKISSRRAQNYAAFVTFGAYTGQRSMATVAKLTVGQFREALKLEKPVLLVESSQDKIRMTHWVPIAPQVVKAVEPLLGERQDDELMFLYSSAWMWFKRQRIPMSQFDGHFQLGDMRKWFEQQSDAIQMNESIRAHITTHGVSGVAFGHYRNPQKDVVYDVYMDAWRHVDLAG
jgi:hypothetical protein